MKITLMPGIEAISGSTKPVHGKRTVFITRTNAQGKRETRMYFRSAADYQRKSPASQKEMAARSLFKRRQALVRELMEAHKFRTLKDAWDFVRQEITK